MTLMDLTEYEAPAARSAPTPVQAPKIQPEPVRSDLTGTAEPWRQLRDYVTAQIEARFGSQVVDPVKEAAVFKRFVSTWGDRAMEIARLAFDHYDGVWASAPVSVNRFCKKSDPFFAEVIVRDHGL
jgi:hypothetical protein